MLAVMRRRWPRIQDRSGTTLDPVRSFEFSTLALCDFELEREHASRPHQHGVEAWVLGTAGTLALPSPRRTLTLEPGGFAWLAGDLEHHERVGPRGARCFLLRPSPELALRLRRDGAGERAARSPELLELARRLARLTRGVDPLEHLEAEGVALSALALGVRLSEPRPRAPAPWLARVREALDDDPRTAWTHRELATLAGVTPEHLARAFRRACGCTLATYRRRRRLERARRLLRETRASLTAIALATGFADHSHFTRAFRAAYGLTPSAYRR